VKGQKGEGAETCRPLAGSVNPVVIYTWLPDHAVSSLEDKMD